MVISNKKVSKRVGDEMVSKIKTYRYDLVGLVIILITVNYMFAFLYKEGVIIFSDVDFPYDAKEYMNQIIGIWNHRFNSTAMLNTPRLLSILPSFILSWIFNFSGDVFLKVFIFQNIYISAISFYVFIKRLLRVYYNPIFNLFRIILITCGALYYALNPWVMFRIQHIYLLVGYSLFPFVLLQFFKLFDHKFQVVVIEEFQPLSSKIYSRNIKDSIWLGLAISFSAGAIHYFFYIILLFIGLIGLLLLKYTIKYRKEGVSKILLVYKNFVFKGLILGFCVLGFSAYWFLIYVGSIVLGTQASQNNINVLDTYTAFSRHSQLAKVFYLNSYWWPMVSERMFDIYFYISGGLILAFSYIGFSISIKKNHIVLFLGLLGISLGVLATGVYYPVVAPIFLFFVDLPVIGSIFRDPNKLAGLLALCLASSFVFGTDVVLSKLSSLKYNKLANLSLVILVFSVVFIYINSMQDEYVEYFYSPVEEPLEYEEYKEYISHADKDYGIYLPISEEMLQETKIATPYWNSSQGDTQKATGDIHIYNSPMDTLFQYEGNDLAIAYYLRYIQYLIDEERSDEISDYIKLLGSNILVYHNEYLEQEERQDRNELSIELDAQFNKTFSNNIFSVYEIDEPILNNPSDYIYTTHGLEAISLYQDIEGYNPLATPTIFAYQDIWTSNILKVSSGYIDVINREDLLFSLMGDEFVTYPFDWINEGNPFLKWSKTYSASTDWSWYLHSQDYIDRDFNYDQNGGLAVTFAPAMLDVMPYEKDSIKGELIMDFNTMLEQELFFEPDNRELFEVQGNPYNEGNTIQTIHGELAKGDPKDIWQVAKSGLIPADGQTPYHYELIISGRFIESMHLKARFYDENMEEIGVSYVVAPDESVNFDTVKFIGEVISDPQAKWMRLDLLSYQQPIVKSYWWIHDINIYDFSEYSSPNIIKGNIEVESEEVHYVYARSFQSENGGIARINLEDNTYELDNYSSNNKFKWINLGQVYLSKGQHLLELEAIEGFNAVNSIVIIPESKFKEYDQYLDQIVQEHEILTTIESSLDLYGNDQLLSKRTYPDLSYGKGIALADGKLNVTVDILKDSFYSLDAAMHFPLNQGDVRISMSSVDSDNELGLVIGPKDLSLADIYLEKASYQLEIDINSMAYNHVPIDQLHKFEPGEVLVDSFVEDPYMSDCSECESISLDMMSHEFSDNEINIEYEPTCSCDWYIYSSNRIEVMPGDEWYIKYLASSEGITKRHGKIIYLDDNNEPFDYSFIHEVEESDKIEINEYEQIIEVPDGASGMYLQFWARGSKKEIGNLMVKDLLVYRYLDFITLDHLIIKEEVVDLSHEEDLPIESKTSEGSMIFETSQGLINSFLSPNAFWVSKTSEEQYKFNSVTAGYILEKEKPLELYIPLYRVYLFGLGVSILCVLLSLYYFIRNR